MKNAVIKHQKEVRTLIESAIFTERVINLLDKYTHQKVIVRIETTSGGIAIDNYEIQSHFDFDVISGIFYRASDYFGIKLDQTFICTVEVWQ